MIMTAFLSHLHADIRRARLTRRGATHVPKDVPRGTHKEYPRMERVQLPEPTDIPLSLSAALQRRTSYMKQGGEEPISISDLGSLFGNTLKRREGSSSRNYPSGGALFPIETYLIATKLEGAAPGVFHYHPTANALERLWDLPADFEMTRLVSKPDFLKPSALILFTAVWNRSSAKYGDLAYSHALLEAGHMSENVLLACAAFDLQARPMAGFNDQMSIDLLDLDEEFEQPVHSITLSKGAPYSTDEVIASADE